MILKKPWLNQGLPQPLYPISIQLSQKDFTNNESFKRFKFGGDVRYQ